MPSPTEKPDQKATRRVTQALRALREFHTLGLQSLQQLPDNSYRKGQVKAEAQRRGVHFNTLWKARAFASEDTGYTPQALDRLCDRCQAVGMSLGPSHMKLLLSVPQGPERQQLEQQLLDNNWSCKRLAWAVRQQYGRRAATGPQPTPLATQEDFLHQVETRCRSWLRWAATLSTDAQAAQGKRFQLQLAPEELRLAFQAVSDALVKLQQIVTSPRPVAPRTDSALEPEVPRKP